MIIATGGYFVGKRGQDKRTVVEDERENEKAVLDAEPKDNQARRELGGAEMRRPELHGQQAPTAELPAGLEEAEKMA